MVYSAPFYRDSHPGVNAALIALEAGMVDRVIAESPGRNEFTAGKGKTLWSRCRSASGLVDEVQEAAAKFLHLGKGVDFTAVIERMKYRPHRGRDSPTRRVMPGVHMVMPAEQLQEPVQRDPSVMDAGVGAQSIECRRITGVRDVDGARTSRDRTVAGPTRSCWIHRLGIITRGCGHSDQHTRGETVKATHAPSFALIQERSSS